MTGRDRLAAVAVVGVVIVGGVWLKVVSPERSKVSQATGQVESARKSLHTAQQELNQGKSAQARYAEAYASVVSLGKAVPASQQVPALVYELDQASNQKHVEFASISPTPSSGSSAKASKEKGTGFEQMPFTFAFNGSYADLFHLANTIQGYAVSTPTGQLSVTGRLLTIQSFKLAPVSNSGETSATAGSSKSPKTVPGENLAGTVTATAYVLPVGSALTAGASPSGPSSSSSSATPASSSGSGSSSTAAATIKAVP